MRKNSLTPFSATQMISKSYVKFLCKLKEPYKAIVCNDVVVVTWRNGSCRAVFNLFSR